MRGVPPGRVGLRSCCAARWDMRPGRGRTRSSPVSVMVMRLFRWVFFRTGRLIKPPQTLRLLIMASTLSVERHPKSCGCGHMRALDQNLPQYFLDAADEAMLALAQSHLRAHAATLRKHYPKGFMIPCHRKVRAFACMTHVFHTLTARLCRRVTRADRLAAQHPCVPRCLGGGKPIAATTSGTFLTCNDRLSLRSAASSLVAAGNTRKKEHYSSIT
jgi:hypothetical protein